MRVQVLAILIVGLMLSGCMTTQEFGNSLASAGVGANSGGITALGGVLELVGNRMAKPSKGTPEYEAQRQQLLQKNIKNSLSLDLAYRIDKNMTDEQVRGLAASQCSKIDKAVNGEPLTMLRSAFTKGFVPSYYHPDGEGDELIYPYPLKENPFGAECLEKLTRQSEYNLARAQGKNPKLLN